MSRNSTQEAEPKFDPLQFIDLNLNCNTCGKSFTRKDAADRHARTHWEYKHTLKGPKRKLNVDQEPSMDDKDKDTNLENHSKKKNNNNQDQEENKSSSSSDDDDETSGDEDSHFSDDFSSNDDLGLSGDDEEEDDPSVAAKMEIMSREDDQKPYGCCVCGQKFKYEKTLEEHDKIHGPPPAESTCPYCNKTMRSKQGLERHLKTHSEYTSLPEASVTGSFLCNLCGKHFNKPERFRKHMALHENKRPFLCAHCASSFVTKYDLTRHEKIHTEGKDNKCTFEGCTKAYREKRRLLEHMRVHTGKRLFIFFIIIIAIVYVHFAAEF